MVPRAVTRNIDTLETQRTGGSDGARYGHGGQAPDFHRAKREERWEHPPLSQSIRHEEHVRRLDDRHNGGQVQSGDIPSRGFGGSGYGGRRNIHVGSEPASRDDMFGSMAPCWRLLERARAYMDKVWTFTCITR